MARLATLLLTAPAFAFASRRQFTMGRLLTELGYFCFFLNATLQVFVMLPTSAPPFEFLM
jgi:hypothetical protein